MNGTSLPPRVGFGTACTAVSEWCAFADLARVPVETHTSLFPCRRFRNQNLTKGSVRFEPSSSVRRCLGERLGQVGGWPPRGTSGMMGRDQARVDPVPGAVGHLGDPVPSDQGRRRGVHAGNSCFLPHGDRRGRDGARSRRIEASSALSCRRWRIAPSIHGRSRSGSPGCCSLRPSAGSRARLPGLLVAAVPLLGTVLVRIAGETAPPRSRADSLGLAVGLGGVAVLVGFDIRGADLGSFAVMAVVVVGYATGPFIVSRKLADVPGNGVVAVSLALTAVVYAPFGLTELPAHVPSGRAIASVVALGVVCTAASVRAVLRAHRRGRAREGHGDHLCEPGCRRPARRRPPGREVHRCDGGRVRPDPRRVGPGDQRWQAVAPSPRVHWLQ